MSCCSSPNIEGTNSCFSAMGKKHLKRFEKKGFEASQKNLFDGIINQNIKGLEVLEIGCGSGYFHQQLISNGAIYVTGVDIAQGMIDVAQGYSKSLNRESQTEYILGDFLEVEESIKKHDIMILDKVFCCYVDANNLLKIAEAHTKKIFAFTLPRNKWYIRNVVKFSIKFLKFIRSKFHPYFHDPQELIYYLESKGWKQQINKQTFVWQSLVFVK